MTVIEAILFGFAVVNFGLSIINAMQENKTAAVFCLLTSGLCVFAGLL